MKRKEIEHLLGQRVDFVGKFVKFSIKRNDNHRHVTMLFEDVYIDGVYIDHIWVLDSRRMRNLDVRVNSIISFSCIVQKYFNDDGYTIGEKRSINVLEEGRGILLSEFVSSVIKRGEKISSVYLKNSLQKQSSVI